MNHEAIAHRRRYVRWQARKAFWGVLAAAAFSTAVVTGAIPVSAAAQPLLLTLAFLFAMTRLMRGIWAARVARHLLVGWSDRRMDRRLVRAPVRALPGPVAPPMAAPRAPDSADRRAVMALTQGEDELLIRRARAQGLALADRMGELRGILADGGLTASLRRPIAEELARAEAELEALLSALGELGGADRAERHDVLGRLAARLEVEQATPALA